MNDNSRITPRVALGILIVITLLFLIMLGVKLYFDDVPYPAATVGGFLAGLTLSALVLGWLVRRAG